MQHMDVLNKLKEFWSPSRKPLNAEQLECMEILRRFLYDPDTIIWMTPDGERILEKYDIFHRIDQAPEVTVYMRDNDEYVYNILAINHEYKYSEHYDRDTWYELLDEVDNEIRKRRQIKIDRIRENVVAGMRNIKPSNI